MTKTFAVDDHNDLYIGKDGRLAIATGLQAILQNCDHAARALLGEMVLAVTEGIPYFQSVFDGTTNIQQYQAALRTAFLAVDGVIEVVSLIVSKEADRLNYTAIIRTGVGTGSLPDAQ